MIFITFVNIKITRRFRSLVSNFPRHLIIVKMMKMKRRCSFALIIYLHNILFAQTFQIKPIQWIFILILATCLLIIIIIILSGFQIWYSLIKFLFDEFKILIKYSASNLIILISLSLIIPFNKLFSLFSTYLYIINRHIRFYLSLNFPIILKLEYTARN